MIPFLRVRPVLCHLLLATFSLGLVSLAFHPVDWSWLSWVAFVPWFVWHAGHPGRGTIRACLLAYHLHFASVLAWVGEIVWPAVFLIPLLGYPFLMLMGWLLDRAAHRWRLAPIAVYPLVIPTCEWLRDQALGLSWSSVGYTQWRWTEGLQLASLGRVHALSAVVLLVNAALATVVLHFKGVRTRADLVRAVAVAAAVVVGAQIFGTLELARPQTVGPYAVGVQVNVPQGEKHRGDVLDHLGRAARLLGSRPRGAAAPDLLVFPETSWPRVMGGDRSLEQMLAWPLRSGAFPGQTLQQLLPVKEGATAILGYAKSEVIPPGSEHPDDDDDGLIEWNIAGVVRGHRIIEEVAKRKLVPFGEFVPWPKDWPGRRWMIEKIRSVGGFVPDMIRGVDRPLVELAPPFLGRRFGLSICYEIVDPSEFRDPVARGADFIVNISNDGWYRESAELDLVQVATIFRAAEVGRSILRVSNTGISTLVDPRGRVLGLVLVEGRRKSVAGLVEGRIPLGEGKTPYVVLGEWVGLAFPLLLLIFWGVSRRSRKKT